MSRCEVIISILSALLVAVINLAAMIFTPTDEAEPRIAPPQIADQL
jgi:hypothetical protein